RCEPSAVAMVGARVIDLLSRPVNCSKWFDVGGVPRIELQRVNHVFNSSGIFARGVSPRDDKVGKLYGRRNGLWPRYGCILYRGLTLVHKRLHTELETHFAASSPLRKLHSYETGSPAL